MNKLILFILLCNTLGAQINPVKLSKGNILRSECTGPNDLTYAVELNQTGLTFHKYQGVFSKQNGGQIIIPFKNELNFKVNSCPKIACDLGDGKFKGRIYVCWSDLKNGARNEDVFLAFSDDEGTNWSEPILISYYPNHRNQFKPDLYVNKQNGKLYVLYYDNRNSIKNNLSDITLAMSDNGGLQFEYLKLNKQPFDTVNQYPYFNLGGNLNKDGILNACWFEKNIVQSVSMNDDVLKKLKLKNSSDALKIEKTFLFGDTIRIPFISEKELKMSAAITKPLEPGFEKVIISEKKFKTGNNELLIKPHELDIKNGTYILTLYYNQTNRYCWITEE